MSSSNTPTKIGRYPVLRVLGKGAMGCVYLARDSELERDVAIKTVRLPQGLSEQQAFLVRFRNEARAVGRLRHRSIVSVYDVGNDPESGPYLVFEYIEGANLKDILRSKGPLAPGQVVALAEQVAEALDAAHRAGIIHRDIKPENLLLDRDNVVHLADFGVARVPDAALTGEGVFLGTPCYGAPETLRGGEATPLSDQFSFAAVLYEAASGTRAFPGSDAVAVAHAVIHEPPKPPSRVAQPPAFVPREVDEVIMRALSKSPGERYPSINDLVRSLSRAYAQSGRLPADGTLPALLSSPRSAPPDEREVEPERKLPLWPVAVFALVGIVAAFRFVPSVIGSGTAQEADAGVAPDAATLAADPLAADQAVRDAAAVFEDAAVDAGGDDASLSAPDAETLSSFEREERAKDALERAERALQAGDKETAKSALDEAYGYDPEHPDIAALRRKL